MFCRAVILPKRTGTRTAVWVGDTEDWTETGQTYGQLEIPIDEAAATWTYPCASWRSR
jgi:hypothetical protein